MEFIATVETHMIAMVQRPAVNHVLATRLKFVVTLGDLPCTQVVLSLTILKNFNILFWVIVYCGYIL